jgi:type III pantothenate kinase
LCEEVLKINVDFVSELSLGIDVAISNPTEVGNDRLVTAVAAHDTYGGPLIVIDFGTATTFDVLDKHGMYVGGVIAPGINLSMDALHMAAALLPKVTVIKPESASVIGTSTVTAMRSGIFWGYIGLIEGLVKRIRDERGGVLKVIATGGLASLFSESTSVIDSTDDDLILRGLRTIYYRNHT